MFFVGKSVMFIGKEKFNVKPGDIIPIPKKVFHHIEKVGRTNIEILVVTNPKYNPKDNIE
jgi:mannose-6-phosphate isomerase-like protein (cupin superfamily)